MILAHSSACVCFYELFFFFFCPNFFPANTNSPVTSLCLFMELSLLLWFAAKTNDLFWCGDTVARLFVEKRGRSSEEGGVTTLPPARLKQVTEKKKMAFNGQKSTEQEKEDMEILINILIVISNTSLDMLRGQMLEADSPEQTEQRSEASHLLKPDNFPTLQNREWNTPDLTVTAVTSFGGLWEWGSYHTAAAAAQRKPIIHPHLPLCSFR